MSWSDDGWLSPKEIFDVRRHFDTMHEEMEKTSVDQKTLVEEMLEALDDCRGRLDVVEFDVEELNENLKPWRTAFSFYGLCIVTVICSMIYGLAKLIVT